MTTNNKPDEVREKLKKKYYSVAWTNWYNERFSSDVQELFKMIVKRQVNAGDVVTGWVILPDDLPNALQEYLKDPVQGLLVTNGPSNHGKLQEEMIEKVLSCLVGGGEITLINRLIDLLHQERTAAQREVLEKLFKYTVEVPGGSGGFINKYNVVPTDAIHGVLEELKEKNAEH